MSASAVALHLQKIKRPPKCGAVSFFQNTEARQNLARLGHSRSFAGNVKTGSYSRAAVFTMPLARRGAPDAVVAQLAERRPCKARVAGSIPCRQHQNWGCSSVGRASALQAERRRFDPDLLHQVFGV